jgi:hypothetical protein
MARILAAAICIKKNIGLDWYNFGLLIAGDELSAGDNDRQPTSRLSP